MPSCMFRASPASFSAVLEEHMCRVRAAAAATIAIGSKAAMLAKSAGGASGLVKGVGLLAAGVACYELRI